MRISTMYERLMPTTADGHTIKVTTYYSSFDEGEIDRLELMLKEEIGTGIVTEKRLRRKEK